MFGVNLTQITFFAVSLSLPLSWSLSFPLPSLPSSSSPNTYPFSLSPLYMSSFPPKPSLYSNSFFPGCAHGQAHNIHLALLPTIVALSACSNLSISLKDTKLLPMSNLSSLQRK